MKELLKIQKQPPEVFFEKTVPKNFAIFTRKYPFWRIFEKKNPGLQACNFLKSDSDRCFLVIIVKFLKTPILMKQYLAPDSALHAAPDSTPYSKTKKLAY